MPESKKIIMAATGLSSLGMQGGIASYVHELAVQLSGNGHQVVVYLFNQRSPERELPEGCGYSYRFFQIPPQRKDECTLVAGLLDEIERYAPDVVINNDISYLAGLWPVLSHEVVKISVVHGFKRGLSYTNFGIQGKMAIFNWPWIDWIVCQNSRMVRDIGKKYRVPSDRLVHVPQTATATVEAKLEPNPTLTLLYGGGIAKTKGAAEMRALCRRLAQTDWKFKMIWCLGAGKTASELAGDSRFCFPGKLSRTDFIRALSDSDCILIPTHLDTGPMLLVEAMSVGTVPICNDLAESAIPDIVENGRNGFRVKGNAIGGYMAVIESLLASDLVPLKQAALNYYANHLTPVHQAACYQALFRKNGFPRASRPFSASDTVHSHAYNTADKPLWSKERLAVKFLNCFEIVVTEDRYRKWGKYLLN